MSTPDRRLILRVNELFHDLEGEEYERQHPEIFTMERKRWEEMFSRHLPKNPNRTIVDIGAGTGFVGSVVAPLLRNGDTLVCADISQTMLECCKRKLTPTDERYTLNLLKLEDEHLNFPDASVDAITLNSVLHHIPDPEKLLAEIARVLKPGGALFIGHEPNTRFYRNPFLFYQSRIIHHLTPKRLAAIILKRLGLYDRAVSPHANMEDTLISRLNDRLLEEGLIDHRYSRQEFSPLIDVHSPTAGGMRKEEGFDPLHMLDTHPTMHLAEVKTYAYFFKVPHKALINHYEKILRRLLPRDGGTFFLVASKT